MNTASLKVHGDSAALADIRDGLPVEPENEWEKGDVRADGRAQLDAGFYISIGEDKRPDGLKRQVRLFLDECQGRGITFNVRRVSAELQLSLGDGNPEGASLDFSVSDLELLIEMGISLSVDA